MTLSLSSLFLLLASMLLAISRADKIYSMKWTVWNNNTIFLLGEGLTGSYAGIQANRSGSIDFTLWFVNSTFNSFTLSVVAMSIPPRWIPGETVVDGKVVWTANRNNPVHWGASLVFSDSGNLELKDADGSIAWSTKTYSKGVDHLWMTNMGNIILQTSNNDTLWQSFDSLTDTLTIRRVLKPAMKLVSSLSNSSSSEGSYSLVMEPGGVVMYASFQGSTREPYWIWSSTGDVNLSVVTKPTTQLFAAFCTAPDDKAVNLLRLGQNFSSIDSRNMVRQRGRVISHGWPIISPRDEPWPWGGTRGAGPNRPRGGEPGLRREAQSQGVRGDTESCDAINSVGTPWNLGTSDTYVSFLRLLPDGDLLAYASDNANGSWSQRYALFEHNKCGLPRKCGPYRICRDGECAECPGNGTFVDVDPAKPELGCKPVTNKTGDCSSHEFHELQGYDYFASKYQSEYTDSAEGCRAQCSKNCSCQAAFYREDINGGFCFVTDYVATIQSVSNGSYRAFVKFTVSHPNEPVPVSHRRGMPKAGIAGAAVGGVIGVALLGFLLAKFIKQSSGEAASEHDEEEDSILELSLRSVLPRQFSYEELVVITKGFCEPLGAGAFGTVYKGVLEGNGEVAVKKLENATSHLKEFYAEIAILARSRHWNLVQLLGYSTTGSSRLLVYEYMANGSLDAWLFDEKKSGSLSWKARFNIAIGTARGLAYLHEDCSEKIIHLDLKPQNILLDSDFNPKIGDFGLSKLVDRQQSYVMTTMRGTPGYLALEWLVEGVITEKIDVYSYGVVLLELVSGRKFKRILSRSRGRDGKQEMKHSIHDGENWNLDPNLVLVDNDEANRAVKVAFLCIQDEPSLRPSMSKVVQMLEGTSPIPELVERMHSALNIESLMRLLREDNSALLATASTASSSVFNSSGSSTGLLSGR